MGGSKLAQTPGPSLAQLAQMQQQNVYAPNNTVSGFTAQQVSQLQAAQMQNAANNIYAGVDKILDRNLTISTKQGVIVVCCETGRVSLPEGMPPDVAASEFWASLQPMHARFMNMLANKLAKEIFQEQWEHALKTRFPKLLAEECDKAHRRGLELGIVMGTDKTDWQGKK